MILCSYCKVALEQDDARFCLNCGKPTSPRSQELSVKIEDQRTTASPAPSTDAQNTPGSAMSPLLDVRPSPPSSSVPQEPATSDQEPERHGSASDAIEERSTLLLESDAADASGSQQTASEETKRDDAGHKQVARPVLVQPIPAKFSAFPDAVSRLTSPLPSVARPDRPIPSRLSTLPSAVRRLTSAPTVDRFMLPLVPAVRSVLARLSELPAAVRRLTSALAPVVRSIPAKLSVLPNVIRGLASSAPALLSALFRARQRLSMPLVVAVLVALVLVGVGSWLLIDQPFSVPPVTQPQLGFSDAHLGLSLLYPNGWTTKKNASDSIVQFSDSSQTAQVIIAVSNRNTATITAALQKQSAQLGMSGVKSVAALSFAGASWQGTQGTVQQSGASYTCTIFATTHANHLVMLTQLAPQSVYNQEDSIIFSTLRQSLRFF